MYEVLKGETFKAYADRTMALRARDEALYSQHLQDIKKACHHNLVKKYLCKAYTQNQWDIIDAFNHDGVFQLIIMSTWKLGRKVPLDHPKLHGHRILMAQANADAVKEKQ